MIAQANADMDDKGKLTGELVSAREAGELMLVLPERIDYMDVAPSQIVSVAASLIPFLEHDDANCVNGFEHATSSRAVSAR